MTCHWMMIRMLLIAVMNTSAFIETEGLKFFSFPFHPPTLALFLPPKCLFSSGASCWKSRNIYPSNLPKVCVEDHFSELIRTAMRTNPSRTHSISDCCSLKLSLLSIRWMRPLRRCLSALCASHKGIIDSCGRPAFQREEESKWFVTALILLHGMLLDDDPNTTDRREEYISLH